VAPESTDDERPVDPRVAEFEAALADRDAALADRDAALALLKEQVDQLQAQVALLTEKLNQNSSNSHRPPSSDGPGAGAGKRGSKKDGKRQRGGQKGHRGAHRELVERVDDVVNLFPEICEGCGTKLPENEDIAPRRYQVLELLLGKRHITEFRRHEVSCPRCRHRTLAAYDKTKIPSSPFGPRLIAVVAMLTGVYHLSRRKSQQLLRELFDIEISLGALSRMEARASQALKSAFDEAQREVQQAEVKHTDGTSWVRAGLWMSLWTIASVMATVYCIVANGRRETIQPLFGPRKGILISDRATVFGFWNMALRQICWAHLIRKFVAFSERDGPAGAIGRELLDYAALVFEYWHGFKDGALTREELENWMRPVRERFEAVLARAVADDIERVAGSCEDILEHADALWTFVTHDGVEPTNNHAERELRAFVLWRKRSFGSQSERGERFAERLMTVAHTARKQGKDVLDFIVRSVTAHIRGATPPTLITVAQPA
jgi:transposase